jgi:hypothetical protein
VVVLLDLEGQYNETVITGADANVWVPNFQLGGSIQYQSLNLIMGTTGADDVVVENGYHAVLTAGGSDTLTLGSGTTWVAMDGMADNGDIVTINNFTTANGDGSSDGSNEGDVDTLVLYNLNTDDLRADGTSADYIQLIGEGTTQALDDSGLLVFTTAMDFGGDAAAAIEAAVEGMSGIGNGETLFAIGRDGEDAALVRVEIDSVGEHTTTQIADINLQAGGTFDNLGDSLNGFVVNFSLPEVG